MATPTTQAKVKVSGEKTQADLEAEIDRLRDDISKLTSQLQQTGQHSYSAAKRATADGVEHLRLRGEAAMEDIRGHAHDVEQQLTLAVREKPITSLAMAAGVGFLFALLTRR